MPAPAQNYVSPDDIGKRVTFQFELPNGYVGEAVGTLEAYDRAAETYLVRDRQGYVLVDSGLRSDAADVKAQMTMLGSDWKEVRAILLTHAHVDHSGGAEHLRAATGERLIAYRQNNAAAPVTFGPGAEVVVSWDPGAARLLPEESS